VFFRCFRSRTGGSSPATDETRAGVLHGATEKTRKYSLLHEPAGDGRPHDNGRELVRGRDNFQRESYENVGAANPVG